MKYAIVIVSIQTIFIRSVMRIEHSFAVLMFFVVDLDVFCSDYKLNL